MNWARIVLDGLAMCVVFNVSTALLWTIRPTAFSQMMPKEIRKAAPSHFFQHYYPETEGCAGYHSFGFNRKEHLHGLFFSRLFPCCWRGSVRFCER